MSRSEVKAQASSWRPQVALRTLVIVLMLGPPALAAAWSYLFRQQEQWVDAGGIWVIDGEIRCYLGDDATETSEDESDMESPCVYCPGR
jgi:hypothetical protein